MLVRSGSKVAEEVVRQVAGARGEHEVKKKKKKKMEVGVEPWREEMEVGVEGRDGGGRVLGKENE